MLSPPTRLDPERYYACLGLDPAATPAAVVAAFRAKARVLHPDVPVTGDANAFVALKQAYDILSDPDQRAAYDRRARQAATAAMRPEVIVVTPAAHKPAPTRYPQFSDLPLAVWIGLAGLLAVGVFEAATRLMTSKPVVTSGIKPNAASVEPLSPAAHRDALYGPTPVKLAGNPNFYVVPAGSPAVLWRQDVEPNRLVAAGQLPPFSSVQAIRLVRQTGMLEVVVTDQANGFISADHLTPGNATAAHLAYCSYNAGSPPVDGELLERHGQGNASLAVASRAVQPMVLKLRDEAGALAVAVFLNPGGRVDLNGLARGTYHAEFAVGEMWSRACNVFAAGMRARRLQTLLHVPMDGPFVVSSDVSAPDTEDIPDQAFGKE